MSAELVSARFVRGAVVLYIFKQRTSISHPLYYECISPLLIQIISIEQFTASFPPSHSLVSVCPLTLCEPDSAASCYRIEPGTIAGIIAADVLLTLIIVIATYRCASFRREKIENAHKVYMNVRANCQG
ncbi:hypothetical protein F2P81_001825 [Scophthalmus maximus]|uniref:Hematopoietic cell signal transducer n=1 Tax=Scophthalmus maximus TaxID=52904 RepID=A0A6A4TCG5_SCOMX|nr:hypothetical protein F2P81_001825 [Scophthalmus maximus]